MVIIPKSLQKLIDEFSKLPGIGPKTASRLALAMLNWDQEDLREFGQAISALRANIGLCRECYTMAEGDLCEICQNAHRDKSVVAVVEKSVDVFALESTGDFHGVYHVLGGTIAPIEGVGPDNLRIAELVKKAENGKIKEIILATNADLGGETTAMYVAKQLKDLGVRVTRIARGLPIGGELEYADEVTLTSALEGRREYGK